MLPKILKPISDELTQLCWVGRYGGLTKCVMHKDCDIFAKDSKILQYPISCNVDVKDCWENDLYLNLVPNSAYKSIVYWEEVGGYVPQTGIRLSEKGYYQIRQKMRLVIWLNMPLLGYTGCSVADIIVPELMGLLHNCKWTTTDQGFGNIASKVTYVNSWKETINKVFKQYNYGDKYQLFLFPYDVLSLDVEIEYMMDPNCVEPLVCGEPVECLRFDL